MRRWSATSSKSSNNEDVIYLESYTWDILCFIGLIDLLFTIDKEPMLGWWTIEVHPEEASAVRWLFLTSV